MPYHSLEPQFEQFNLSYYCRGCKQKVRGIPVTDPQYHISSHSDEPWLIVRCPTRLCELSFVIYDKLNSRIRRVFPLPNTEARDFHEAIPLPIREDLAEADRCFHASAFKGTVTMLRRVVQRIVIDKIDEKSIKKKLLWEQIDKLYESGLITKNLKDTAHEVRHFGNFGAHPFDDQLDETTREEAKMVDTLTWELVKAIYITPYQTEQLRKKRKK